MTAIIPSLDGLVDLVRLVDLVDGLLHLPEVLRRHVLPDAAELALDGDAPRVVRGGGKRVEGRAALWVRVVVVVVPVADAVVYPARGRIYESGRVEGFDVRG